ncbi:chemotaxis protein CheW [Poseidonocella sp. HB161398]|uniref:chemotaxis protein CheW n=1 Tax=Poseidonocella sp. HB161398 TaxID=2320855 RepID=UPI001F112EFF|nr:chemotaxis protein CheW [Poseidonocella sp. HB161398]
MQRAETVVTFALERTIFAIEVRNVQEILSHVPATRLPRAPAHLLGLIDVRGRSVPLVDLRLLLGETPREEDDQTRVILLWVGQGGSRYLVALRVDRVIEVALLDEDGRVSALEESALFDWDERMVEGIGRRDGQFVILLRLAAMFDPAVAAAAKANAPPSAA